MILSVVTAERFEASYLKGTYRLSQPDKYRWSFLTISKQGEGRGDRIKGRIQDRKDMELEDKPEWCPQGTSEILEGTKLTQKKFASKGVPGGGSG